MKLRTIVVLIMLFFISQVSSGAQSSVPLNYDKIKTLTGYSKDVLSIAFSPSGSVMAIGTADKEVIIWDTKNWQIMNKLKENGGDVRALAFSRDGKYLASGDRDKKVILWDTQTWKKITTDKGF